MTFTGLLILVYGFALMTLACIRSQLLPSVLVRISSLR